MKSTNNLAVRCMHLLFGAATLMLAAMPVSAQTPSDPEATRVQAIAEDAYVYGLPLVMTYGVMYSFAIDHESTQFKAPFNQLRRVATPLSPKDRGIPFPNNDTLYSMGWLDLRTEPMVISLPAVEKSRYHSVMLTDLSSINHGLIGTRTTGNVAGNFLVAAPNWQGQTPKNITKVYRSTSQFTMALFRTQLKSVTDIDAVKDIQASYRLQPLSAFLGQAAPTPAADIAFPKIDRELAKANFFAYLDLVLRWVPPRPEDKELRERLASIGLGVGKFDEFKVIAGKYRQQLMLGVKTGDDKINQLVAAAGPRANGWNWNYSLDSDRDHYTGDYARRAAMSRAAPYGLNASEAMYPMTNSLPDGELLDASKHRYTLTFRPNDLPPVELFWSLSMYEGATRFFADNPINRYFLNSGMLPGMTKNSDGSLTLYIQKDSPGAGKEANWLPAPDGPIYLVLRLYGPQAPALRNEWVIPAVVKVD